MITSAQSTSQDTYEVVAESDNAPKDDSQDRLAAYDHGFRDGQRSFIQCDIHDLKKEAQSTASKLRLVEADLERKMKGVEKQREWYENRKTEMKGWREEQMQAIWDRKKVEEKRSIGWFRFGGNRTRRIPVAVEE